MPVRNTFFMPNWSMTTMDLYSLMFQIFSADWKTFMGLGLLQMVAMIGVFIVYFILAGVIVATQLETLMPCFAFVAAMAGDYNGAGAGRFLVDHYVVGDGGVSRRLMGRMLDDYEYNDSASNYDMSEECHPENISAGAVVAFFIVMVLTIVLFCLASSTFVGAIIHAASEAIVADSPASLRVSRSMSWGWKSKCAVFSYQMLLTLAVFVAPLLLIAVVTGLGTALGGNMVLLLVLSYVAWLVFIVVVSTVNVGAIPSIVVEKVGVLKAFPRSWSLCKSSFCLIFCTMLGFQVMVFLAILLFVILESKSPMALALVLQIVRFVVSVAIGVMGAILATVIYTSLRIRNESTTPEEISQNLMLGFAEATAVEMVDGEGAYKDSLQEKSVPIV